MAFQTTSGKTGSVLIGTVAYPFKDFDLKMDGKTIDTSNFAGNGYRTYIVGLLGATCSFNGNYNTGPAGSGGESPLVIGTQYTMTVAINSTINWTFSAIVSSIDLKDAIDDAPTIAVTAMVNGAFQASVV